MKSGIPHLTGQYFENELGSVEKANVMSLLIKVANHLYWKKHEFIAKKLESRVK
jgi:hypothetical protein